MNEEQFVDMIIRKTVKRICLKINELPLFDKPIVYMVLGNDTVLYIGMSSNGLQRIFTKDHHVISKIHKEIVSIELYETQTTEDAVCLERAMITEFKPTYNGRGYPKKEWQTSDIINHYDKI